MQDVGALGSSPPSSFSHQMGLFMQVPSLAHGKQLTALLHTRTVRQCITA